MWCVFFLLARPAQQKRNEPDWSRSAHQLPLTISVGYGVLCGLRAPLSLLLLLLFFFFFFFFVCVWVEDKGWSVAIGNRGRDVFLFRLLPFATPRGCRDGVWGRRPAFALARSCCFFLLFVCLSTTPMPASDLFSRWLKGNMWKACLCWHRGRGCHVAEIIIFFFAPAFAGFRVFRGLGVFFIIFLFLPPLPLTSAEKDRVARYSTLFSFHLTKN